MVARCSRSLGRAGNSSTLSSLRAGRAGFFGTAVVWRSPGMVLATAAEPVFKLHSAKVGRGTSGNFQIVPFYLHRDRALNTFDGDNQVFAAMIVENPFEAIQGPSPYAHALPVAQKGTNRAVRIGLQQALQRFDLAIRNGGGPVRTSGETDYAGDLQYG